MFPPSSPNNPVGLSPAEPAVPFKKRLQDLEVREKESATFQCEVALPATEAAWFKEETRLWASAKYRIEEEGTERRLTVRDVSADDDAVYICETTEGSRTVAELSVQGRRGGTGRHWAGPGGQTSLGVEVADLVGGVPVESIGCGQEGR